jgi:uncharacterized OsmC-like protein
MPIQIEFRKDNRIVSMNVPGKTPILSRAGAFHFHNSMELLCISYGSCFGKAFWEYCYFNKVNIEEFESFVLTMEDGKIYLTVQHPDDMTDEVRKEIVYLSSHCPISKMLINKPEVKFILNETPKEILTDETKRSNCCGQFTGR